MRVGHALINANEGNAEPLAAVRQNLPVSQVEPADDEGLRAARCLVQVPSGGSKTMRSLFVSAWMLKALSEGPPEVFPHRRGDRLVFT